MSNLQKQQLHIVLKVKCSGDLQPIVTILKNDYRIFNTLKCNHSKMSRLTSVVPVSILVIMQHVFPAQQKTRLFIHVNLKTNIKDVHGGNNSDGNLDAGNPG